LNKPQRLVQPGARNLLARILDQPHLAEQIQRLPPAVLGSLIDRIGLEDAGELVALATTEQLADVFDDDLWKNQRPGEEERFDAGRFLVWLEVMLEAGDAVVARKLAELPEDLVTLAFHRHVLVLNLDALALEMQAQDEVEARLLDKALESCLYEEIGEYQVMSRSPDGWDSVLAALLALDPLHHDLLVRILERCCHMTGEFIDDNGGLYDVLTSDEMLEGDVAGDREDRRAERGYVAPPTASAFLKLARRGLHEAHDEHDPVTRAYLRDLARSPRAPAKPVPARENDGLSQVLREAAVIVEASPPLLPAGPQEGARAEPLVVRAMRRLGETEPDVFATRSEELAYLANVLVAGCTFRRRRLRPIEALRVVMAVCSLGVWQSLEGKRGRGGRGDDVQRACDVLRRFPADGLFRRAWFVLQQEVIVPAADLAMHWVAQAAARAPKEDRAAFARAEASLRAASAAGAPWKALPALDVLLGVREHQAVETLRCLIDECPALPGGEPGAYVGGESARFFSSGEDLAEARALLKRLQGRGRAGAVPAKRGEE
jgi:hypothetical protein